MVYGKQSFQPNADGRREENLRTAARPLWKQFSWTLPANVFYGACQCLLLVVLNHYGSPSVVGQFGLALSIAAPVFLFAHLRLATMLATDVNETVDLAHYVLIRVWCVWGALLLLGATASWFAPDSIRLLLVLVALTKATEAITDFCYGVQQRIHHIDRICLSLVAHGLLTVIGFTAAYLWTRSLSWGVVGLLLARLLVLVGYDLPMLRRAARSTVFTQAAANRLDAGRWLEAWRIVRQALPLGLTALSLSLTSNVPRYLIAHLQSDHALGIFCTLAATMQIGTLVFRAVDQPVTPRLARLVRGRERASYWKLFNALLGMFVVVAVLGAGLSLSIGPWVLEFAFGGVFVSSSRLLALMFVVSALGQIVGIIEQSLIAVRITVVQLPMHLCTLVTCAVAGWFWIPLHGLHGAVWAMIVARMPFILVGVLLLHGWFEDTDPVHLAWRRVCWSWLPAPRSSGGPQNTLDVEASQP